MIADYQIHNLILEMGHKHGLKINEPDKDGAYVFNYDNKFKFSIRVLKDKNQIVLSSCLCTKNSDDSGLHKKLLHLNFLCLDTQGSTFSLDPQNGDVHLCRSHPVEELDTIVFEKLVEQFLGVAQKWHLKLSQKLQHHETDNAHSRPLPEAASFSNQWRRS